MTFATYALPDCTYRIRRTSRWSVALIGMALLTLQGCNKGADTNAAGGPIPVTTLTLAAKQAPLSLEIVGRTEGSKEVEVRARVSGILQQRAYKEGVSVAAGTVLFRIDPATYEIALARAKAALAQEQARNNQARRNADRIRELLSKNLASRNDADVAVSALEASDAAILVAQANVREAELNLSYTNVAAPISGITGRALRSDGSLVTAGTESSLLTTISQSNPIWARFAVSANEYDALRDATKLASDLHVELLQADGTAMQREGKLNFAASTVDTSLGTVQLRAEFPNRDMGVLPGEYVRLRVIGGTQSIITVPQNAVLQGAQGAFVWLLNQEGKAEQRKVKTGAWEGSEWRVLEGLKAGETIIVDNLLKLRGGAQVVAKPKTAGANPAPAK